MVGITIQPPSLSGTEGDDQAIYTANPGIFAVEDIIAIDVLTDATFDLLGGNDSVTGVGVTLSNLPANAIGIENSGDFLGNSGNDTIIGTSLIVRSGNTIGRFSIGIGNLDSQALISGGQDNDRIEGIAPDPHRSQDRLEAWVST